VAPSPTLRMREREKRIVTLPLSEHLPLLAADMNTRREMNALRPVNAEEMAAHHACALGTCVRRSLAVAAFVDLRIGNAAETASENRRKVIATFSEPGKQNDTRQTEV
jgi:small subunit ribosomal protein S15